MAINTEPSTFEFAAYWLVSSECFVRDCLLRTEVILEDARAAALERIHDEEVLAEPEQEADSETSPDLPPPVDARPRAIVRMIDDRRDEAGTGTVRGSGRVEIDVEIPMPAEFRKAGEETQAEKSAKFKAFRAWCRQLVKTLRDELMATKGRADEQGNPYLNAVSLEIDSKPYDQEIYESEPFVAFTLAADWR